MKSLARLSRDDTILIELVIRRFRVLPKVWFNSSLIRAVERHTIKPFAESLLALLSFEGTSELHEQLIDTPPDALAAVRADPVTGEPSAVYRERLAMVGVHGLVSSNS
jgi:hypothetical protein